jgi:hypothetical protein
MQLSDKPRKKISCKFSPIFLFFLLKKMQYEKKHHMQGKIKPDNANTKKQSLDLLFFVFPNKHLQRSPTNIGGKNKVPLVPRLQIRYNKISNQT